MQTYNTIFTAIYKHASLALRLKHDGTGMPKEIPATLLLSSLFMALVLINHHYAGGITLDTILKVGFVAQCYTLFLRNPLAGLLIFISTLCNAIALVLVLLVGVAEQSLNFLLIAEYIMVSAAVLNVLKKATKAI